jgi:hypothetical protein
MSSERTAGATADAVEGADGECPQEIVRSARHTVDAPRTCLIRGDIADHRRSVDDDGSI